MSQDRRRWMGEVLLFWVIITVGVFRIGLESSEADTMALAHHHVDPSWVADDWNLDCAIGYRWLFNQVFGRLMILWGTAPAIVLGRLLAYLFMALAFHRLMRSAKVPVILGVVILYWCVKHPYIAAGEWMVKGLETKTFAWSCALLAIACFVEERWRWCWFWLGATLTFHVLVGLYTGYAVGLAMLWQHRRNILQVLRPAWMFLLSGIPGVAGVVSHGFDPVPGAREAWEIYVTLRVPHHTMPNWTLGEWTLLIALVIAMLTVRFGAPQGPWQRLSVIGLLFVTLTAIGLVIRASGRVDLLRFHWFRTADAALPMLTYLALAGLVASSAWYQGLLRSMARLVPWALGALVALMFYLERPLPITLATSDDLAAEWKRNSDFDVDMAEWIRSNTPVAAMFLIPPDIEDFYLSCDRRFVVAFKHAPQMAGCMLEWHQRMIAVNDGKPVEGAGFPAVKAVNANYERMSAARLGELAERYDARYLLARTTDRTDLPLLHRTAGYALYALPGR